MTFAQLFHMLQKHGPQAAYKKAIALGYGYENVANNIYRLIQAGMTRGNASEIREDICKYDYCSTWYWRGQRIAHEWISTDGRWLSIDGYAFYKEYAVCSSGGSFWSFLNPFPGITEEMGLRTVKTLGPSCKLYIDKRFNTRQKAERYCQMLEMKIARNRAKAISEGISVDPEAGALYVCGIE